MEFWQKQEYFFTIKERENFRSKKILIAGLGSLGSNIAEDLVRLGIKYLTVADFDVVELNNLNRQNYVQDDIMVPKVHALEKRLKDINKELEIKTVANGITLENVDDLVKSNDIIIDCCDDYPAKILIARKCLKYGKNNIHSSGGGFFGAVTSFYKSNLNYEKMFHSGTKKVSDKALFEYDFSEHRKKVINFFGLDFDKIEKKKTKKSYIEVPTVLGASDIASHITSYQVLWIALERDENIIKAPTIFLIDMEKLTFNKKEWGI